jgi:hypothetical protein
MSTARRQVVTVPPAQKDKKHRRLAQRGEAIYEAGYSGTTTTVNYETVATASGSKLREVTYEIPAPVLPIPTVSLPEVVDDITWTHDDPAVPLVQFGETPYVTSTSASHRHTAARAGKPSMVSRAQRFLSSSTSPRHTRRHVPCGSVLRNVRHAVWCIVPVHGLLLQQDALQSLYVYESPVYILPQHRGTAILRDRATV